MKSLSSVRWIAAALLMLCASPAFADSVTGSSQGSAGASTNLQDLISDFIIRGITLAPPGSSTVTNHSAHFVADSGPVQALRRLNQDLGVQLSSFPLSSSAGGFTYTFDPALGVFTRNTGSFGPIYAERHNTLGKGRLNIGVSYSNYSFDEIDDLNLRDGDLRLVFAHEDTNGDGSNLNTFFEGDFVTAQLYLKLQSSVTAFVATIGATDRLDLGVAVPIVDIDLRLAANAQVRPVSTGDGDIHVFPNGTDRTSFREEGSASGLGDILLRAKYSLTSDPSSGFALAADLRAPTGEYLDLLGSGEWQVKGSLIGSGRWGSISPHVNAGYQFSTGEVSDELQHLVGFDWAITPKVTFASDLQGRYLLAALKLEAKNESFLSNTDPNDLDPQPGDPNVVTSIFPNTGILEEESRYALNGLIGLKINVVGNLLVSVNGLVAFTGDGLTDRFTPLVGVDYSF